MDKSSMNSNPVGKDATQASESQTKTKAKQRYLKAKKDRRKKRKSTTAVSATAGGARLASKGSPGAEKSSEDHESADDASETDGVESTHTGREARRPKKRRKIVEHENDGTAIAAPVTDRFKTRDEGRAAPEASSPALRRKSPTPLAALPSFPLPIVPNAPSKSTLALQGLDKALIEAEFIDPAKVLPLPSDTDSSGLSDRTRKRLTELGISELFAVQTAVVPFLLTPNRVKSLYLPYSPPRDVCVSAPTGSGKTLAYVLPIVEILSTRIVTRLRALIVLPTRDLVIQVRETFEAIAKGRGLKIGTATGQHSFAHEQSQLVADKSSRLQGGSSKVDILICTPGRFMDHLTGTPNFSLQHLRFLVIDEADRLLAQSFQDWLAQVLIATQPPPSEERSEVSSDTTLDGPSLSEYTLPQCDALSPAFFRTADHVPLIRTDLDERKESSCQKLLFSATLTRDPAKIAALNLHEPKYLIVQHQSGDAEAGMLDVVMEKFSMPSTLTEHMIVCDSTQKPLNLFHLVHSHGVTDALVFTKSAESTIRLVRLFEFFEAAWTAAHQGNTGGHQQMVARAYSSDLGASERKSLLEKFRNREIHLLVCSDLISRGIDISHVSHVVSYDAPVDMRKYVHRVGRTARAGRAGDAWTLVEEQEARYFKSMLGAVNHLGKIKRLRISDKDVLPLRPAYESALGQLKDVYARPTG